MWVLVGLSFMWLGDKVWGMRYGVWGMRYGVGSVWDFVIWGLFVFWVLGFGVCVLGFSGYAIRSPLSRG